MLTLLAPSSDYASPLARRLFGMCREFEHQCRRSPVALIGHHPSFLRVQEQLARFADANSPVIICGETGTGKELFARALHVLGRRSRQPYIVANCAQFQDPALAVSQLFGYRRGSFTGAHSDHAGLFEAAHNGTLFLDEISELPLSTQALLLRAIGEEEITRMGESASRHIDVRVIGACAFDLRNLVRLRTFREDLYYRLRLFQIDIPALRDRRSDIPLIAQYFLDCLNANAGGQKTFSQFVLDEFSVRPWPGNVRELRGTVELSFVESRSELMSSAALVEEQAGDASALHAIELPRREPDADTSTSVPDFWRDVHRPFLKRQLNRDQVQALVSKGLLVAIVPS